MKKLISIILCIALMIVMCACGFDKETDTILCDDDNCTLTLLGYKTQVDNNFILKIEIVNKSNEDLLFGISNVKVNGENSDPYWATKVEAGKTVTDEIKWDKDDLAALDSSFFKTVTFSFRAFVSGDSDNWFVNEFCTIDVDQDIYS